MRAWVGRDEAGRQALGEAVIERVRWFRALIADFDHYSRSRVNQNWSLSFLVSMAPA